MSTLFIFRRDFRLEDHRPLQKALDFGKENDTPVIPVFIFTPEQVSDKAPIRSSKSIQALIKSLEELDEELHIKYKSKLHILYDDNVEALKSIQKEVDIKAIFETKDYTPYAKQRTIKIFAFCKNFNIHYELIDDLYLTIPGSVLNKNGKIYQKFTYFYNEALNQKVEEPLGYVTGDFGTFDSIDSLTLNEIRKIIGVEKDVDLFYSGGRAEGLELLKELQENVGDYPKTRDIMALQTSGLSVHHHYGTVSIRETYHAAQQLVKKGHTGVQEFIRQLYWRDFYGQIMCFFKELYGVNPLEVSTPEGGEATAENPSKKDSFLWPGLTAEQERDFDNWSKGTTGIPIIDAAMSQLNLSGYMHNRSRLLTSSYLVKTMGVPWRLGERYFATKLLDYDFTQNMCNWMLIASVERLPFVEPPFRKHLPDSYKKRFDPEGEYISFWE